ncbi:MAG: penicillin acylase family protein [Microthrixaceae bacterium]
MPAIGDHTYEAELAWTTEGVAHVRATGWGDVGFGQGWACARDNLAIIADQLVKVTSSLARTHGPGEADEHLASDLGYLALDVMGRGRAMRDAQPELVRRIISGYVAGYNAWVAHARTTGEVADWACDADGTPAGWIRPVDEEVFYAYYADVAMMASGRNLVELIGRAEAPGPDGPAPPSPDSALGRDGSGASNGWAVGGDVAASGHGMVLGNPHFPWYGEARFWECHLNVPGQLDVYGVSLLGLPGVQIGFTESLAWTHTFSGGNRFTLSRLDLAPGEPTRYRHGDDVREMVPQHLSVEVLGDDGGLTTVERTLWRTHHGPMVNLPMLGWGNEVGFAYRDANDTNTAVLQQFLAMNRCRSVGELQATFRQLDAMPWANTLAADRDGRAWYADTSSTPNLSPEAQDRFTARLTEDLVAALLYENRVAMTDGSEPGDDWIDDPDASRPGLVPADRHPSLERRDILINANDSHWLTHPDVPLEGHSVLCGLERTPRSLRTRQNLRLAQALTQRGGVSTADLIAAVLDGASLSAELLVDEVVQVLRQEGREAVADILDAWDRNCGLEARGTALWREIMAAFGVAELRNAGALFNEAFDPDRPLDLPRGLATDHGPLLRAVDAAVAALERAEVALDAPLAECQWADRNGNRVPVPGGSEGEGVLNVLGPAGALNPATRQPMPPVEDPIAERAASSGLARGGYQVTYGTTFLFAVELTDDGPVGLGVLASGQSGDPASPHHGDGAEAYASGDLRPLLFQRADIDADPNLIETVVTG